MSNDTTNSREWNAAEYHRLSTPQFHWGQKVLHDLSLRGDECVLDAGCGTGRLTHILLENLPRGRVVGLDLSRNMVLHAQRHLRPIFGERVQFIAADLSALPFRGTFDGIFSTAAFHWVLDHDILFRSLFNALRPGGWLHAQCGGGSNIVRLRERAHAVGRSSAFAAYLNNFPEPWYFSDAEAAANRLQAAGFEQIQTALEPADVKVSSSHEFQDYLRTFVLHRHLQRLPDEQLRTDYLQQITSIFTNDDPPWVLDYCRLNLSARKPL
jgi:trans-aconitate 2-methyltransferase